MEESVSGFEVRGTWADVVEHGERITRALRDAGVHTTGDPSYPDAFAEWDEWRPKLDERLEEGVSEKTAEQASVDRGDGEKEGASADEDVQTAGEKLEESYEEFTDDDVETAVDKAGDSLEHVARAADTASRKTLRRVEETVYERVMTQVAPYYFDNTLVSANIQRVARSDDAEFAFEVNVNDDDLKAVVSERLADYEETVDRWHVATDRETDVAEAAEGAESPAEDGDDRARPMTN